MSKKTAPKSKKDQYYLDLRADTLAFDLMSALPGFTFEIPSRTDKIITLSVRTKCDTNPIIVIVTQTDYVINGTHYSTCDETVNVLSSQTPVSDTTHNEK